MIKVAIVGNIASGKSVVEKILREKNYKVFDTDKIAHEILNDLEGVIKKSFAEDDIIENGIISRAKLGKIIFSNNDKKKKLEKIVHPEIKNRINKIFADNSNEKFVFIAIPLLFEVNWCVMFDKILFISANDEIRLKRLMQRNNYSKEEATARINAQLPQSEKEKRSDYVIKNNDDISMLQKYIEQFIIKLEYNGET